MISDAEIIRRVRAIRFSSPTERNARRAPSINALAKQAGLSRKVVHEVAITGHLGSISRAKLSRVMTCHDVDGARSRVSSPCEPASERD